MKISTKSFLIWPMVVTWGTGVFNGLILFFIYRAFRAAATGVVGFCVLQFENLACMGSGYGMTEQNAC